MKKLLFAVLLSALAGSALWAADFWHEKPYSEWTDKEVDKLLTNSPWAQRVSVASGGGMAAGGGMRRGGGSGGIASAERGVGGIAPGGGGGNEGRSGADLQAPTVRVTLRWHSALPVRQALVRSRLGNEADSSQEAQQFLNEESDYYILEISGLPPQAARQARDTAELREKSVLKRGKKPDIMAEKIEVQQAAESVLVYVIFPKTNEITVDDKNVDFLMNLGSMRIRRRFNLRNMVFDGKLAI